MKIKLWMGWLLAFGALQSAAADSTIERAQTALKAQGFYYGTVSGEKNADTTAAIRRFQIRNGLQVTGELNQETRSSLNGASRGGTVPATTPVPRALAGNEPPPRPSPPPLTTTSTTPLPAPATAGVIPPLGRLTVSPFKNTPYEQAPPQLQSRVLLSTQSNLRRRGYYRGALDGRYNGLLEFSLRAYQSNRALRPTGRLDLDTLSSLGLLPPRQQPILTVPPRRYPPQPWSQAPVRGEWIHERAEHEHD